MNVEPEYHPLELGACVLSRDFQDGERILLGAMVTIGRAAVLIAHLLRGPNMRVMSGLSWTNLSNLRDVGIHGENTDHRDARFAEAYVDLSTMIVDYRFFTQAFVVSALQVDALGNTNLIGIGDAHDALKVRGPGAIGSTSSTAFCERFYIVPPSHTRRVFVERCDFVSTVGFGYGPGARERLGMPPGGGPRLCITERCVLDFDETTKRMRLKSVHPGHTVEEIVENTGFELVIPSEVPETEPPRPEELDVLRNVIDRHGLLRPSA